MPSKRLTLFTVLLATVLALCFCTMRARSGRGRNVILIVLDTMRADHLGVFGYELDTTPNLDQFASESVIFRKALSTASWTPPSVASILTGRYVISHGLTPPVGQAVDAPNAAILSEDLLTIPEVLKANGYRTGGVTANTWSSDKLGFGQGFERYDFYDDPGADKITAAAEEIVNSWNPTPGKDPFFLYVHYIDPHVPYKAPEPFASSYIGTLLKNSHSAERVQPMIWEYDAEIKFMDHYIGELFKFLKEKKLYDDSLIIIVGDHGEQFEEHGKLGHGYFLYNEEVHVPLLVKDQKKHYDVDYLVSTVDIFPTVLNALGIPVPSDSEGISLFDEQRLLARPGVISEISRYYNQKAFISIDNKKIIYKFPWTDARAEPGITEPELIGAFDLKTDPYELSPSLENGMTAPLQKELFTKLNELGKRSVPTSKTQIDEETLQRLRTLGYFK